MFERIYAGGLLLTLALGGCSQATTTELPYTDALQWGAAPAVFPAGAQMAVIEGDPAAPDRPFTVRRRFPDGYAIAPHTHPTDENITVLAGTFLVGMGDSVDEQTMLALAPGGFVTAPAAHPHYAKARGETVVQVHALGPFEMTYSDPADDPRVAARP